MDGHLHSKNRDIKELGRNILRVISGYIRGIFLICLIEGSILALGLYLIGIPFALWIGYFGGLMNFIPTLGVVIGIIPAVVSALFAEHRIRSLLLVGALYTTVQVLDAYVIGPKILGRSVGLHPVLVVIAVMVGAHFFGVIGVIIAVPVTAILMVIYRYLRSWKKGRNKLNER